MCAAIGSTAAFSAITAIATIATNTSYLFPIVARYTIGRKTFMPSPQKVSHFCKMHRDAFLVIIVAAIGSRNFIGDAFPSL